MILLSLALPAAWSPWSGIFSRPLAMLTADLPPLLPPFEALISPPARVHTILEIGVGVGRALIEAMSLIAEAQRRNASAAILHRPQICAVGTTFLNYTKAQFALHKYAISLEQGRREGLGAALEEGQLSASSAATIASRFGLRLPAADGLALPTIVDMDYSKGLPFATRSFDLLLSQASIKMRSPGSEMPSFLDECARVLAGGGSALLQLMTRSGSPSTFIRRNPLRWRAPGVGRRTGSALLAKNVPGLGALDIGSPAVGGSVLLEAGLGTFAEHYAAACATEQHAGCARPPCIRGGDQAVPGRADRHHTPRRSSSGCLFIVLHGTVDVLFLTMHRVVGSCDGDDVSADRLVRTMRQATRGTFRAVSEEERKASLAALDAQEGELAKASSISETAKQYARFEAHVVGVRRWMRVSLNGMQRYETPSTTGLLVGAGAIRA